MARAGAGVSSADRLAQYRAKRDFSKTDEPAGQPSGRTPARRPGAATEQAGPRFVVQRHRARRLHYDFRLEVAGVLVSWAVPKGPTLDPDVRRAAFHVEDHPLEYVDFEGVIPAGQYGGGDVIVWDAGTWEADEGTDPVAAVTAGELHVDLHGQKLQGRFVLVRTKTESSGKEEWLMLHKHDEYAARGWDGRRPSTIGAVADAPTRRSRPIRSGCGGRTSPPHAQLSSSGRTPSKRSEKRTSGHSTRWATQGRGRCSGASSGSPTWTRCCSPREAGRSR